MFITSLYIPQLDMIALQNSSLNDLFIILFGSLYCGFWKPCKDKFYFQHVSLSIITLGEIFTMTPRSAIVLSLFLLFEILLNQLNQNLFLLVYFFSRHFKGMLVIVLFICSLLCESLPRHILTFQRWLYIFNIPLKHILTPQKKL
jgi:hypothetical protein